MSFFEDIAAALDREGVESRVHDETMFVPITSELEIQFVEIDPHLPAANVYIAAADVDEDDEEFEAVLVSVVFSVDDAIDAVAQHMAEDQRITVFSDLLEGTDERISDLDFFHDPVNPDLVRAEVGDSAELRVLIETIDGIPTAAVSFVVLPASYDDLLDDVIGELWESDGDAELSDEDRERLFASLQAEAEGEWETLELGTYVDFDRLFDVLSLAADHAEDWEAQLVPVDDGEFDEPDVYDLFAAEDDTEEDTDEETATEDTDDIDDIDSIEDGLDGTIGANVEDEV
ncbi:hypothetical protein [Corynebacterium aquatimens]|uniref:Uncharacterized protein n=1 Tax=Corynebacterium aquatimens TaxID=1190508 RepID=A0A931GVJ3_9CORY|nr:hypothetical protein [Corynebacterium aquatimens]MBG6121306.1 hypothetical protein [Corynebacterium aquatimens]WJY66144.1 hypothetical protein CAQUA_07240 [Corynebacterium aquatimens]